ncbi:MAG TPA: hypothetical protein VK452_02665 [Dissulfurispiraceae bacterium]|nr:hypothetical protein [Dissulfurispiraceae bacterium]
MISELLTYLMTPCPNYVRSMGYLYQAIALRGRYRRRRESWQRHLENTQQFIGRTAEKCRNRRRVVVIGSGILLDVPLDRLSEIFGEVVLADIVHLPEVRRRAGRYPNVRLVQCDVTGLAEALFSNVLSRVTEFPVSKPFLPDVDQDTGLVVSVNILSQLAEIPLEYASKKMSGLDEAGVNKWCDQIRAAHYRALKELPCDVCLVADYAFARRDRDRRVVEEGSTVGELMLPEPDESWTWEIAPLGEESRDTSKELRVGAWRMSNR